MARTSCSSIDTIPKETVLAMLQARSVIGYKEGETVQYTNAAGVTNSYRVTEILGNNLKITNTLETLTVPASSVKSLSQDVFLDKLQTSQWSVTSFDPRTRVVCISIENGTVPINMTVTLPVIDPSSAV